MNPTFHPCASWRHLALYKYTNDFRDLEHRNCRGRACMTLGVDAGLGSKAQRNTQMLLTSKKTSLLFKMETFSVLDVGD